MIEEYRELIDAIFKEFTYVAEKFNDYRWTDSRSGEKASEVYSDRLECNSYLQDEENEYELLNYVRNNALPELEQYKNEFNRQYASNYRLRDVFDVSMSELRNIIDYAARECSRLQESLRDYIREKGSNEHFRYPVSRAKEKIYEFDCDVEDMKNKLSSLSSYANNKIVLHGITVLNVDNNEKLFEFAKDCMNLINEWSGTVKSIRGSLPH